MSVLVIRPPLNYPSVSVVAVHGLERSSKALCNDVVMTLISRQQQAWKAMIMRCFQGIMGLLSGIVLPIWGNLAFQEGPLNETKQQSSKPKPGKLEARQKSTNPGCRLVHTIMYIIQTSYTNSIREFQAMQDFPHKQ